MILSDLQNVLKYRHQSKAAVRQYLDEQGFVEIDTPYLLKANTPDPYIDPLWVRSEANDRCFQLHTSPEIWLKRALTMGFDKIYQLARVFRDDPLGQHHGLEFAMLEWYRAHEALDHLEKDCEEIFSRVVKRSEAQGLAFWPKTLSFIHLDVSTAFERYAQIDLTEVLSKTLDGDDGHLRRHLMERGSDNLPLTATFLDAFFHVMLKYVEPNLPADQVVVLSKWPIQLAALSKAWVDDPKYCQRFELYFGGIEIANAYQECNDPVELMGRFNRENRERLSQGKPAFEIDQKFLEAVGEMPESAGIALGIDRLLLSVARLRHISDMMIGDLWER